MLFQDAVQAAYNGYYLSSAPQDDGQPLDPGFFDRNPELEVILRMSFSASWVGSNSSLLPGHEDELPF